MDVGQTYRITAGGVVSTASTTDASSWIVRIGVTTLTGTTTIVLGPTIATSITNEPWYMQGLVTVGSTGANPTVYFSGEIEGDLGTSAAYSYTETTSYSGASLGTANPSTSALIIQLNFKWGSASSSDIFRCVAATIEEVKS
jgi:hypothetical protein